MSSLNVPVAAGAMRAPASALARAEFRMGARTAAFRLVAALAFLVGWSAGNAPGRGASYAAYSTGEAAWQYLGFVAILWLALAAAREAGMRTESLIYSKPQPTERLVLARFMGSFGHVLSFLLALFVGAAISRLVASGSLIGYAAFGYQLARCAGILFFAAAASFCLALLAETPVAGALVGLYWVVTLAGKEFLSKAYFPAYTQNLPAYLLAGVFLFCLALGFHRRKRRGDHPIPLWIRAGMVLAPVLAVWLLASTIRNGHDPQAVMNPIMQEMEQQTVVLGERAPGFLLPDQHGRPTALSDFPDRILLIALWSPRDVESAFLLDRLNAIHRRYGKQGVLPVAICVSEDAGAAPTFALGGDVTFPVVTDWGAHNAPKQAEASPLASAYQATILPTSVLTDRRRRVRILFNGIASYDGPALEQEIQRRLREEPE